MSASEPKNKRTPFRRFIPNLVTIFAMCAGLTAIRVGLDGHYKTALYLIVLAMFLDAADGKIARYLKSESQFGAELDTLADFLNFGVVPAILLYRVFFAGTEYASIGWLAVLLLCVCCALRLARFNVALDDSAASVAKDKYFVGVPAPALACLALMPLFLLFQGWTTIGEHAYLLVGHTIFAGYLAISTLPTFSLKHLAINANWQVPVMIFAVILIVSLTVYPWRTLAIANMLYLFSLPVSFWMNRNSTKR